MGEKKQGKKPKGATAAEVRRSVPVKTAPWYRKFLPLLVILPLVFAAFSPILNNELTNWDDPDLIIENPLIRELSLENIKTIFTEFYFGNYQPLHLLSYAIEYHFWELNPAGYHAVSLALFLITTLLVYYFIYLIGNRNIMLASIATLLFAINGMRVESVAWAAERKDMLYALFYTAALITYVRYILAENKKPAHQYQFLVYTFLLFTLAVFSKVMAVSVVGAMVFLDYLYARRLSLRLFLEKIPFVGLSIVIGLVQVKAAASTNTIDSSGSFDFFDRLLILSRNAMFYVYKMLIPVDLSAFHPYPQRLPGDSWPMEFYLGFVFGLLVIALFAWSLKHSRIMVFTTGFYFSALILVLQYVAIGPALFNERYSLIPAIAMSFALASGVVWLIRRYPSLKAVTLGFTGLYVALMFMITYVRCDVWKDSLTLWNDALEQYPTAAMPLNNRGKIYGSELGNTTMAMRDLTASIASDPRYEQPYSNRGIVFCMNGKFPEAIRDFNTALRLKPDYYEAIVNRGIAYAQSGKTDSALADFNRCLEMHPDRALLYLNRGICYSQTGEHDKAIADFNKGMSLDPTNGEFYLRRSFSYFKTGKITEAYQDVSIAKNAGVRVEEKYFNHLKTLAEKP